MWREPSALLPVQSPEKGHDTGATQGNSTHHICSLILLPSSSMVLILKSIPERKGRTKDVIKARPLPGLVTGLYGSWSSSCMLGPWNCRVLSTTKLEASFPARSTAGTTAAGRKLGMGDEQGP